MHTVTASGYATGSPVVEDGYGISYVVYTVAPHSDLRGPNRAASREFICYCHPQEAEGLRNVEYRGTEETEITIQIEGSFDDWKADVARRDMPIIAQSVRVDTGFNPFPESYTPTEVDAAIWLGAKTSETSHAPAAASGTQGRGQAAGQIDGTWPTYYLTEILMAALLTEMEDRRLDTNACCSKAWCSVYCDGSCEMHRPFSALDPGFRVGADMLDDLVHMAYKGHWNDLIRIWASMMQQREGPSWRPSIELPPCERECECCGKRGRQLRPFRDGRLLFNVYRSDGAPDPEFSGLCKRAIREKDPGAIAELVARIRQEKKDPGMSEEDALFVADEGWAYLTSASSWVLCSECARLSNAEFHTKLARIRNQRRGGR